MDAADIFVSSVQRTGSERGRATLMLQRRFPNAVRVQSLHLLPEASAEVCISMYCYCCLVL